MVSKGAHARLEAADKELVKIGIVVERVFNFAGIDAVALDKGTDIAARESALLPPAVEIGKEPMARDKAQTPLARALCIEPAQRAETGRLFDDEFAAGA